MNKLFEKQVRVSEKFLDITRIELDGFAELLRRPASDSIVADMEKLTLESDEKRKRIAALFEV